MGPRPDGVRPVCLSPERTSAYLGRIGAPDPAALAGNLPGPDAGLLRELHHLHLLTVPFENLGIHLGEPLSLAPDALYAKLVTARRGGFCYELNGLFASLLASLGYPVTLLSARVYGAERLGPPFDHLALLVDTGTPDAPERWLVDVGFGRHTRYPLRYDDRDDQEDPCGLFRIAPTPDGDLDVIRDGVPQYRVETRPRALSDFEMACWWQSTSPHSYFTRSLVCSLLTPTGRITLSGDTLTTTADPRRPAGPRSAEAAAGGADGLGGADGVGAVAGAEDVAGAVEPSRGEVRLPGSALLAAYREHFGITLDRLPALRRF